jgi:hypothetical protein
VRSVGITFYFVEAEIAPDENISKPEGLIKAIQNLADASSKHIVAEDIPPTQKVLLEM